ncbi:hypothetical protein Mycsm_06891 (plasmid) [Mycobacterium sp. JS623]|uniref:hypothetical protein n=1 Tax=Mycobacterium sp. JS623 TaxID=212767 RepID=UPI0002A550FB|nr:hypothetical protein [Mycobacterium sp. JS623]AGB26994.1 hypothetical protein Mycsm_06891 [Mycobacterium sp. JS623]
MEIDYAMAYDFIDDDGDGRPYQLRFRREQHFSDQGQLIAVIASAGRSDNGTTCFISRPGVSFTDVEQALDNWESWAMLTDRTVSLSRIRAAITTKGLG